MNKTRIPVYPSCLSTLAHNDVTLCEVYEKIRNDEYCASAPSTTARPSRPTCPSYVVKNARFRPLSDPKKLFSDTGDT